MSLFQSKEDQDFAKALIEYMSIIQRINLRRKERNEPPVDDGRPKRRNKKRRRRGRRGQRDARRSELTRVADEKSGEKLPNVKITPTHRQRTRQMKARDTVGMPTPTREDRVRNLEVTIQQLKVKIRDAGQDKVPDVTNSHKKILTIDLTMEDD